MFAKAKRFDYYPKPEVTSTPRCDRCLKKHNSFCLNSSRPIETPKKKLDQVVNTLQRRKKTNRQDSVSTDGGSWWNKKSSSTPAATSGSSSDFEEISKSDHCVKKVSKPCLKDPVLSKTPKKKFDQVVDTLQRCKKANRQNSVSSDDGLCLSFEDTMRLKKRKNSNSTSPGTSRSSSSVSEKIINNDIYESSKFSDHYEDTAYASIIEETGHSPSHAPNDELLQYLDTMEKKIDNQRKRVLTLRRELFKSSTGKETFDSSQTSSLSDVANIEERIKHVEDMSRFCVKETLDFVTMYNRVQEAKCASRPQDYKDLVEFCSDLVIEMSTKLSVNKNTKKWKKLKGFFRAIALPFRKISHLIRA